MCATEPLASCCLRYSQDNRTSHIRWFGATLAQSGNHFPEGRHVPQLSLQNQTNPPQNAVSGTEKSATHGTDAKQQPLRSSHDSGMIVFSSSAHILRMNGPARALMSMFGASHEGCPLMTPECMPSILTEFCLDVSAQLQHRVETQDWAQFEMRRICHMVTPSLLLTGFGVPSSSNREIRVIVTLTPLLSIPCAATDSRSFSLAALPPRFCQ